MAGMKKAVRWRCMKLNDRERWQTVKAKIEACSHLLCGQGAICSRLASGRRVWSVRFDDPGEGGRVQRSIYIGSDPELVERARRLLARYRQRDGWCKEVSIFARVSASLANALKT